MKKHILIVDIILVFIFILIIISKFINFPFVKFLQLSFFIFILIHIIQHWKVLFYSLKRILKTNK